MRLTIEHVTHFRFAEPATHSVQYLRLTPRADLCQRVIHWQVETAGRLTPWTDGFDNPSHVSVQDGTHDEVAVTVRGVVETTDTNGILPLDDGLPPQIFLRHTAYTGTSNRLRKFAKPFAKVLETEGALAMGHALMAEVADKVEYRSGVTTVETKAEEVLEHGYGVCQDQAHVMIAAARLLGLPARYVSGYLLAGVGNESHIASHAWTEMLVDDLGWVSFDPANRQCATDSYVRLALGLDYETASPIRGIRRGGGVEEMDVRVQVQTQ